MPTPTTLLRWLAVWLLCLAASAATVLAFDIDVNPAGNGNGSAKRFS